jgi:sugar phosphate isomerase/epimerase
MDSTTNFESIYTGGYSSLDPESSEYFIGDINGKRMEANYLGFPGSPGTANQLGELANAAKQGVGVFEVTALIPDTAETIPKQHFKEMRALMKLSGIKPSMHGPLIDPSGFGEKGWEKEEGRANNERRMFKALEDAHTLDPNGNVPVVFHGANGAPGKIFQPGDESEGEDRFAVQRGMAINRETGEITSMEREHKYRPESPEKFDGKGSLFAAEKQLGSVNRSVWDNELIKISEFAKSAQEIIGTSPNQLRQYRDTIVHKDKGGINFLDPNTGKAIGKINSPEEQDAYNRLQRADQFLENAQMAFNSSFNKAYKYGTSDQKKKLKDMAEEYKGDFYKMEGYVQDEKGEVVGQRPPSLMLPIKKQQMIDKYSLELQEITNPDKGLTPQIFQEAEEFAINNASKTFSNLAAKAYDKWGENSPILAVENLMPGMAFSRTKELKQLIEKSRDEFAKKIEGKVGKKEAQKIAEKQIGVTWDLGHLNLLRKTGFEEKDLIKESEDIAPMVKHVHLTDNFGHADTHLPVGMGNVPTRKHLEALEKKGDLAGVKRIVEAGNFVKEFKSSPHPMSLRAFGSSVYGMKNSPYWNQAMGMTASYSGGYGTINPQTHHSIYGAGLTTLPMELGGAMPGGASRFSGNQMA